VNNSQPKQRIEKVDDDDKDDDDDNDDDDDDNNNNNNNNNNKCLQTLRRDLLLPCSWY